MGFKKLFESVTIRSLKLKNRILMPTLDPGIAGEGGQVNQRWTCFLAESMRRAEWWLSAEEPWAVK